MAILLTVLLIIVKLMKELYDNNTLDDQYITNFDILQWEYQESTSNFRLYRNKRTGLHCQQYLIQKGSLKDRQNYDKRKRSRDFHIVNVLDYEAFGNYSKQGAFLHYTIRIYLQHIPLRISQIDSIQFNKLLKYLFESLQGFYRIFQQYQPVRVTAQMIGINEIDEIKVWLSTDHRENYVHVGQYLSQKVMVKDIFGIFDKYGAYFEDRPKILSFIQGILYIQSKLTHIKYEPVYNPPSQSQLNYIRRKTLVNQTRMSETPQLKRMVSFQQNTQRPISMFCNNQFTTSFQQNCIQPSSFQKQIDTKTYFQNFQNNQQNVKDPLSISIQSARTTSKNVLVNQNLIQLDQNQLPLQFLDEKKSKQSRLQLIQQILRRQKEICSPVSTNNKKICMIFRHALKYDPVMLKQLQKVGGKISQITNEYMLKRILSVGQLQNTESQNLNRQITNEKIRMILQQQRMKRKNKIGVCQSVELKNNNIFNDEKKGRNLQLFKQEVQKLLFD